MVKIGFILFISSTSPHFTDIGSNITIIKNVTRRPINRIYTCTIYNIYTKGCMQFLVIRNMSLNKCQSREVKHVY